MSRYRFKLRTLFLLVLVSAISIQWIVRPTYKWITLPSYNVNLLALEVNNGEAASAVKSVGKSDAWQRSLVRHLADGKSVKSVTTNTQISIAPLSFADILFGERRFAVTQGHNVETTDGRMHNGYAITHGKMTASADAVAARP